MVKVAIIYHSRNGHTKKQAEAVLEGASMVSDTEAKMFSVEEVDVNFDFINASDAIIFGSPTYMGTISAKYKEFMEEEFKIIGFHEGTGDEKGIVIWECETPDKKQFSVRPKGTREIRKELYDNGDKYIGKLLTVIFQEYTNDGIPRFPVGKSIRDIY